MLLCYPGVTRTCHFVSSNNLPFSLADIREVTFQCEECQQITPHLVRSNDAQLINETQVFERMNLVFKGPLPRVSSNRYVLAMVGECFGFPYRFPFF